MKKASNIIDKEDVKRIATSINKTLNDTQIEEVIERYPFEQQEDPSATWNLVVENTIYSVINEVDNKFDELVNEVIEQIKYDISIGDVTAIDELLRYIPRENLKGYLAED